MKSFVGKLMTTVFLLAGVIGCGAQTVTLSGTGTAPPTPELTLNATSLSFGDVILNTPATQTVEMTSTGTASVTVTAITINGSEFSLTDAPTLPLTLAPAATASLDVVFDPTVIGSATGALTAVSNAYTSPVTTVAITGVVQSPTYAVSLTWEAPTSTADPVVGYNVYRAPHGTGIYTVVNSGEVTATSFTDTAVVSGQVYDYIVESVDAKGNTSVPSNVFTATIP